MVVPVGVFDHYFDVRIYPFGRGDHQVTGGFFHQFQAVLRPALLPLGRDTEIAFAAGEEKVIEDQLVEIAGGIFNDLPHLGPVFRVGIAKGFKPVAFVNGKGDASGSFHTPGFEKGFCLVKGFLVDDHQVAVGLQVNFIHCHLVRHVIPHPGKPFFVAHFLGLKGA